LSYVPVLDLSWEPAVLAHDLDEICSEVGFFQIVGHGVTAESDAAWEAMRAFFDLPLNERLAVRSPTPDYPHGYSPLEGESLGRSLGADVPPDLKEVFNSGPVDPPAHVLSDDGESVVWSPNLWPPSLPQLQQTWTAHHRTMQALAGRLMRTPTSTPTSTTRRAEYEASAIQHAPYRRSRGNCAPARTPTTAR
jgi:isopenicillin N synthase-like dioxygenase